MVFDPAAHFSRFDESIVLALLETMVLAAHADGDFDGDERAALSAALSPLVAETPLEALVVGDALDARLKAASEAIAAEGRDVRLAKVKEALGDDASARKGALGLAVRIVAADGVIRTTEREVLLDLAEGLDVDRDEAADLVRELSSPKDR